MKEWLNLKSRWRHLNVHTCIGVATLKTKSSSTWAYKIAMNFTKTVMSKHIMHYLKINTVIINNVSVQINWF